MSVRTFARKSPLFWPLTNQSSSNSSTSNLILYVFPFPSWVPGPQWKEVSMERSTCIGCPAYNDLLFDGFALDVRWSTNSTRAAATICSKGSFKSRYEPNAEGRNYIHLWEVDRENDLLPRLFLILQLDLTICEQLPPKLVTRVNSGSRGYLFDFGNHRLQLRFEVWG